MHTSLTSRIRYPWPPSQDGRLRQGHDHSHLDDESFDKDVLDDRARFSGLDGVLSCRPAAGCCAKYWLWSGYSCLCSFIWIMHDRFRSHLPRHRLRRCMIHSPLWFFLCILRLLRVSLSFSRRRFIKIARQVYDLLGNRIRNYLTNRGRRGFDDGTIGSCTRPHVVHF